ncbi:MAG TPA: hypothetical protein VN682_18115 [Terriglobales bacterium]|nr:hypothetical protein [Terriglobales bacterium]
MGDLGCYEFHEAMNANVERCEIQSAGRPQSVEGVVMRQDDSVRRQSRVQMPVSHSIFSDILLRIGNFPPGPKIISKKLDFEPTLLTLGCVVRG